MKWSMASHAMLPPLVDGPRVPKFEIQPFTMDEARKFLAAAKGDRLEAPYGPGAAAPVPFAPTFISCEYALRLNSLWRRVVELTPWRTGHRQTKFDRRPLLSSCLSGCCHTHAPIEGTRQRSSSELAPERGFEPRTLRLTAACSTVELLRNGSVEFYSVAAAEPLADPRSRTPNSSIA